MSNRKIEIYQPGSPAAIGIASGSTSASSASVTDATGYFGMRFMPGTATFIIFSGANPNSLTLSNPIGDSSFPSFSRTNFPEPGYDPAKPVYVGKSIDTAVIKVSLLSALTATDTIGLQAYTIRGKLAREYTGRTAPAGSLLLLDTISNMLFTEYDCRENTFINNLYAGRKWTTGWGYTTISAAGVIMPRQLSPADETSKEMTFYFQK